MAADAVDAVLTVTGQHRAKRRTGPAGLTPREIEVLSLIARGASTRQVAHALGITAKTAGTHIERIYTKTGAATRSTATQFAMQHGLLETSAISICRGLGPTTSDGAIHSGRRYPARTPAIAADHKITSRSTR